MTTKAFRTIQRDVVTPTTSILALVVATSGVMLFFDLEPGLVKAAHEWLGLAFVGAAALHLARHWQPAKAYLRRPLGRWGFAGAALAALLVLVLAPSNGPSPQQAAVRQLLQTPLTTSAPALGLSPLAAADRLATWGIETDGGQSLQALAKAAGRSPIEMLALLTAASER